MVVHAALAKGTKEFRSSEFNLHLDPRGEDVPHLRVSTLGGCARLIWAEIKGETPPDEWAVEGLRAVHLGDVLEEYTVEIIKRGGLYVFGEQTEVEDLPGGALRGHIDGIIQIAGVDYLLEIKTLKHSAVADLVAHGVEDSKPIYFSQMQYYMNRLSLDGGYFVALNKDTGQYYVELVPADILHQNHLRKKALNIHTAPSIYDIQEPFVTRDCKWCPLKERCVEMDGEENFLNLYRKKNSKD